MDLLDIPQEENLNQAEVGLQDLPDEVIFNYIFPHLQVNDLLRLRRVNKRIKPVVEDYLQSQHAPTSNRSFPIDIAQDSTSALSPLMDLNYVAPLSRFYIGNMDNKTFEKDELHEFAEIYGAKVTHLELDSLEIPVVSRRAIRFFESLQNLESLEIHVMEQRMCSSQKEKEIRAMARRNVEEIAQFIPASFRRLRTLIIRAYDCSPAAPLDSIALIWRFIEECAAQLEFLRHPKIQFDFGSHPGVQFGAVQRMLEDNLAPNLKIIDLECLLRGITTQHSSQDFYELVTTCSRTQVKLLNVNGYLIEGMMVLETWDKDQHGMKISQVVKSITNLLKSSFLLDLPHLEKITIGPDAGTFGNCSMPDRFAFERKEWANLKEINILIDSADLCSDSWIEWEVEDAKMKSTDLLKFFFVGIRREKMEKLSLEFHLNPNAGKAILPYPRIIDICNSCPNLKELTLSEWPGTNKAISTLWGSLQLLEKVKFDGCSGLGNVAFVGEEKENPELLRANNLRSLTLQRFEMMPKITDTLLTLVLRHMPLKELNLISYKKISNSKITLAGILGLRGGVFSETIEKLFLDFRMEGITEEEIEAVEEEFRSSKM